MIAIPCAFAVLALALNGGGGRYVRSLRRGNDLHVSMGDVVQGDRPHHLRVHRRATVHRECFQGQEVGCLSASLVPEEWVISQSRDRGDRRDDRHDELDDGRDGAGRDSRCRRARARDRGARQIPEEVT